MTAQDKQQHALVGFALGTISATALDHAHIPPLRRALLALAPVVAAGVGKELWDSHHSGHTPEARDALTTIGGGVIALSIRWRF